ncbi:MAG: heparinase II/III family protein [Kiritimatiellae bacterium]|nr:heparinase II/III family protein [Kiritimatiellia bacterium]
MRTLWAIMTLVFGACCCGQAGVETIIPADAVVTLAVTNSGWYGFPPGQRMRVEPAREAVYGLEWEMRGSAGIYYRPNGVYFYRPDGTKRDDPAVFYFRDDYELLSRTLDDEWETRRLEVMVKKGTGQISWNVVLNGAGTVELRNMRLVEGGFPDRPPYVGPPYLDWIEGLRADPAAAREPFLLIQEGPRAYPKTLWNAGTTEILVDRKQLDELAAAAEPYLKVAVSDLYKLVPDPLPPGGFSFRTWEIKKWTRWNPLEPDVLRSPEGELVDKFAQYPVTGHETAVGPRGRTFRYAYHEKPDGKRLYHDFLIGGVKCQWLVKSACEMAALHALTGRREYGLRAAAILHAFALRNPDTPVFGEGWDRSPRAFRPYDNYHWMSFNWFWWYTASMGPLTHMARAYDLLRDETIWAELGRMSGTDARRAVAEDLFLAAMKFALRYDRYNAPSLWQFFHNTIGGQITGLITMGRAIGCPEVVHYAIRKACEAVRWEYGVDGLLPESVSYHQDLMSMFSGLEAAAGYSDPPGYTARVDGRRIERFDVDRDVPVYARVKAAVEKLRYPNGAYATIHDTWSDSRGPRIKRVYPDILPAFGHCYLGRGEQPDQLQAHLHYSADGFNHNHRDPLNLILWAYGEELVSDIGYSHRTSYKTSIDAHNTVVLDQRNPERLKHVGRLLQWFPLTDGPQVAQAGMPEVYKEARMYRRALFLLPLEPGRDLVLDIFEVEGGRMQEWMANACAGRVQEAHGSLPCAGPLPTLADDGKVVSVAQELRSPYVDENKPSRWYGTLTDVRLAANDRPWQVTIPPLEADAVPGLRLHWLGPFDGELILCKAPSVRLAEHHKEKLDEIRMPKVIVRRRGKELASTFTAVWEPFRVQPRLDHARRIPELAEETGVAVECRYPDARVVAVYRKPEARAPLSAGGLRMDGAFAAMREFGGKTGLSLFDGARIEGAGVTARLSPVAALPLLAVREGAAAHELLVGAELPGYPTVPTDQPHAGGHILLSQNGSEQRWLPLAGIAPGGGRATLTLTREAGFTYDAGRAVLREQFLPRRTIHGAATVVLPPYLLLEIERGPAVVRVRLKASGDVALRIDDVPGSPVLTARREDGGQAWVPPHRAKQGHVEVTLPLVRLGAGWNLLEVGPRGKTP